MNKTAIKNFAIWARNKLIADITYKAGLLGITEKEIKSPLPQSTKDVQFFDIGTKEPYSITGVEIWQRRTLVEAIQKKERQSDYKTAYKGVIEEVAYTWFNRLIAVRFMEVNDYLPSRVRVLSSESSTKNEPDLVTSPFEAELNYTPYEKDRIMQLKNDNQLDELFRMLFIKQCNALNAILPELFAKTNDYTELLMNVSFTDKDGVVYHLVHDISEDDFNVSKEGQVEIIGWMYQYYNTEPKQAVFNGLKKNIKITKENIPAATQLFTPDWIVRYMVENSLGRLWLESHPNSTLREGWKYYLDEAEQTPEVAERLRVLRTENAVKSPEDVKVIDPCMGSGHILVYAFEVLMQIYTSEGYSDRDAAKLILEKNIFGLEIDRRAYQLAYFALMMKARQYNRRILTLGVRPEVYEPTGYVDGMEYGSLMRVDKLEPMPEQPKDQQMTMFDENYDTKLNTWHFRRLLTQKYDVVVTNPPYAGASGVNVKLSDFLKQYYPDSKSDLFAAFIERCGIFTKLNGFQAMITQQAWMFLSSYEKLRSTISASNTIINMAHLGNGAFGFADFGLTTFVVFHNAISGYCGTYLRLVDDNNPEWKEREFFSGTHRYIVNSNNFSAIQGNLIAYWASEAMLKGFKTGRSLKKRGDTRQGMATMDNATFLRLWFEIPYNKIGFNCQDKKDAIKTHKKWFPYNKGGDYRKWYGNQEYVVNFENNGNEIKNIAISRYGSASKRIASESEYFKPCISWSKISMGDIALRYYPQGFIFDVAGCCIFYNSVDDMFSDLGFCNSLICKAILSILSPTLNYEVGHISSLPILNRNSIAEAKIKEFVTDNIAISHADWDAFETSWDFSRHPLVDLKEGAGYGTAMSKWNYTIKSAFENWETSCNDHFTQLKANEEELNRIFIDIYGLQDELTPEVEDKDVTVRRADLGREIRSLISYAVGCMFGRYSPDVEGLAYAGGKWDDNKYSTFIPDKDNILPITDEEYFEDDVVGLFCAFLKKTFGEETVEENLDFIAKALGNRGNSSREIIRNYFLKEFFKDHCKIYHKRPIYWLFDSGKADGFKALIYMHRYNEDTIGNLRIDYLHRMQRVYESEISRMQETIENSTNAREVTAAQKRKEKLTKQLRETKDYDEKIAHLALSRIAIDLDDGVKVNYEKVQTGIDGKKLEVLAKI